MNDLATITTMTGRTMSSREIAELTGKNHKEVLRDIRNLEKQAAITERSFALSAYTDASGKSNPEYLLDFDATMTLVTGYNANLRAAVIRRWRELETGEALPVAAVKGPKRWGAGELTTSALGAEFRAFKSWAIAAGLKGNAAVISADGMTAQTYGVSLLRVMGIELKSEDNERLLRPTDIAKILGVKPRAINPKLAELGLQKRLPSGEWTLTEKGAEYGVLLDTTKRHNSGAMVQQIKWKESVLLLLTEGFQA